MLAQNKKAGLSKTNLLAKAGLSKTNFKGPWDRSDFAERWTMLPWEVQYGKAMGLLRLGDAEIYAEYSAEAFAMKTNIIKLSARELIGRTGASRTFVRRALERLCEAGFLELLTSRRGQAAAYRITHKKFASKNVILTTKAGVEVVDRDKLEQLRKRLKA